MRRILKFLIFFASLYFSGYFVLAFQPFRNHKAGKDQKEPPFSGKIAAPTNSNRLLPVTPDVCLIKEPHLNEKESTRYFEVRRDGGCGACYTQIRISTDSQYPGPHARRY